MLFSDKAFGGNKGNGKFVPGYQLLSRCDSSKKSLMIWACADEVCIFAL
ncbi:hypothetical protein SDC9_15517 [bioreactor metagenome]|jgi:reverse gyrase|uniref:Uncharacterized protein n=1 Tax=bioreactor metagenome TaxID=1076179 RepID=A0A644TS11_9ZZZZ